MIRLLLGGSPCTHWSVAQRNNRETKPEGFGWELFRNYLIAKEKYRPDYFLYENNKSAAQAIKDQISKELGTGLQYINSALVSAQNRQRFYAHNIPDVPLPEDRGILLEDILEPILKTATNSIIYIGKSDHSCRLQQVICDRFKYSITWREKSGCLDANYFKGGSMNNFKSQSGRRLMAAEAVCTAVRGRYLEAGGKAAQCFEARKDGRTNVLTTVQKDNLIIIPVKEIKGSRPVRIGQFNKGGQGERIYSIGGKSVCLTANGGGGGAKTGLYAVPADGSSKGHEVYAVENGVLAAGEKHYPINLPDGYYIIRKLTVTECKRLQTVPDGYIMNCSAAQNYKMLGNGWTIDVIAHILSYIPGIYDQEVEVLSLYDGMSCGRIALTKLGADVIRYYAMEIDKYAVRTALENYPDTVQLGDAFQVREDGFWLP